MTTEKTTQPDQSNGGEPIATWQPVFLQAHKELPLEVGLWMADNVVILEAGLPAVIPLPANPQLKKAKWMIVLPPIAEGAPKTVAGQVLSLMFMFAKVWVGHLDQAEEGESAIHDQVVAWGQEKLESSAEDIAGSGWSERELAGGITVWEHFWTLPSGNLWGMKVLRNKQGAFQLRRDDPAETVADHTFMARHIMPEISLKLQALGAPEEETPTSCSSHGLQASNAGGTDK